MPTCPGAVGVPSDPGIIAKSPPTAWDRLVGSGVPLAVCADARCGNATPADAQAAIVSPLQSNELGPAAPKTYGLPSCLSAYRTARTPLADPLITNPIGMDVTPAMLLPAG